MSDITVEIGAKLRRARERAGLKQQQVADALVLRSKVSIHDYEKGKTDISPDILVKLPAIFRCKITDLLPDEVLTDEDRDRAIDPDLKDIIRHWPDLNARGRRHVYEALEIALELSGKDDAS